MNEIKIKIERTISFEALNNLFSTAIEGGSNYWYFLDTEACRILDKYVYPSDTIPHEEQNARYFSERLIPAVQAGEKIPVHDIVDPDERLGFLSLESIKIGAENMVKDGRKEVELLFNEEADHDANDADVVFQYCVMGEIVFG